VDAVLNAGQAGGEVVDVDTGADVAEAHSLGPGQERHGAAGGDHGLGRDAVPEVGGAAADVLLDHDDLGTVAGGVAGRGVAAGATADDHESCWLRGESGYQGGPDRLPGGQTASEASSKLVDVS
jgi:hypothetical protein